jgi:hypothetical protein
MHLEKTVLMEKTVNGKTEGAPYPGNRAESIGTGTKMSDGTEELEAVPFFL